MAHANGPFHRIYKKQWNAVREKTPDSTSPRLICDQSVYIVIVPGLYKTFSGIFFRHFSYIGRMSLFSENKPVIFHIQGLCRPPEVFPDRLLIVSSGKAQIQSGEDAFTDSSQPGSKAVFYNACIFNLWKIQQGKFPRCLFFL